MPGSANPWASEIKAKKKTSSRGKAVDPKSLEKRGKTDEQPEKDLPDDDAKKVINKSVTPDSQIRPNQTSPSNPPAETAVVEKDPLSVPGKKVRKGSEKGDEGAKRKVVVVKKKKKAKADQPPPEKDAQDEIKEDNGDRKKGAKKNESDPSDEAKVISKDAKAAREEKEPVSNLYGSVRSQLKPATKELFKEPKKLEEASAKESPVDKLIRQDSVNKEQQQANSKSDAARFKGDFIFSYVVIRVEG